MTRQVLCYGDSNTWGCIPLEDSDEPRRLPRSHRWTGVLQDELGPNYWVIDEGLNGRTTTRDDEEPYRNGLTLLNVQAFYQLFATGLIILVAMLIDRATRGRE